MSGIFYDVSSGDIPYFMCFVQYEKRVECKIKA